MRDPDSSSDDRQQPNDNEANQNQFALADDWFRCLQARSFPVIIARANMVSKLLAPAWLQSAAAEAAIREIAAFCYPALGGGAGFVAAGAGAGAGFFFAAASASFASTSDASTGCIS